METYEINQIAEDLRNTIVDFLEFASVEDLNELVDDTITTTL